MTLCSRWFLMGSYACRYLCSAQSQYSFHHQFSFLWRIIPNHCTTWSLLNDNVFFVPVWLLSDKQRNIRPGKIIWEEHSTSPKVYFRECILKIWWKIDSWSYWLILQMIIFAWACICACPKNIRTLWYHDQSRAQCSYCGIHVIFF